MRRARAIFFFLDIFISFLGLVVVVLAAAVDVAVCLLLNKNYRFNKIAVIGGNCWHVRGS